MNQAFHLYRLQQIDTQIDQAEGAVAEINRQLAGDETVLSAEREAGEKSHALRAAQQKLKETEFAVRDQQLKISSSEARLYSGNLRNPKEMQDLEKEIASLKKHLAVLEEHQLEAMMALEECEAADASAGEVLARARASFEEKSAGLLGKKETLQHTLERLRSERAAAAPAVDPASLQTYNALRRRKSGVAVATITDGSCSVCGGEIRPSELQAARVSQTLVYCSSCGRIFYTG